MGLDTVELILAIEDEFSIETRDDSPQMFTVGDIYVYLKKRLGSSPSTGCPSQKLFHAIRKGLMENYRVERTIIRLDSRLSDLESPSQLGEGWDFMQLFSNLDMPKLKIPGFLFAPTFHASNITVRELILTVMVINESKLDVMKNSNDDVWIRLVRVIQRQTNAPVEEITPKARFSEDLLIE